MEKFKKWVKENKTEIYFTFGLIFLLWVSVYLFTRQCLNQTFDLTNTGQIGDTIGGITAPIINAVGAILVYLSFKAQISANRIQFRTLNREIKNRKHERNFELTFEIFKQIKEDFTRLTYENHSGKRAINAFARKIDEIKDIELLLKHLNVNIKSEYYYILREYKLVLTRLEKLEMDKAEKLQLFYNVYAYYDSFLSGPIRVLRKKYIEHKIEESNHKFLADIIETHKRINDSIKNN